MARYNQYSPEQEQFLLNNALGLSRVELADKFNAYFGTNKSVLAIKSWCNNRKMYSGEDGRFKEGSISWQTGLKGEEYKSHFTEESFNRCTAHIKDRRKHFIGETVMRHGEPRVVKKVNAKIPWDKRLIPKRRFVWEQAHGKIPDGHLIVNLDGNQENCDLSNLYCISPQIRMVMNGNKWLTKDRETTLAAIKWCELFYAIKQVESQ